MSFSIRKVHVVSFVALAVNLAISGTTYANDFVQFNMDVLDLEDRKNIDLNQFSLPGFIMPGSYTMKIKLNNESIGDFSVIYKAAVDDPNQTEPCLTKEMITKFGIKPEIIKSLRWSSDNQCLDIVSLPGMEAKGDLATATLNVTVPQAYLEYRSNNWEPVSMWDDGVSGLLFDYNITGQMNSSYKNDHKYYNINGNGVVGANVGRWRLRADWQGRSNHSWGDSATNSNNAFDFNRIYAYTALPNWNAKLAVGENYLSSDLFDTFRYTGVNISTDLNMLPPNLRGYAPEVTGVASTNATVIISQAGRVIYQTQVPAGPFAIQDLPSGISGQLDVSVEEQNGTVQNYQVNTANIPYLTRPGQVRYSASVGRPSSINHRTNGELFLTGEFSWGITNGWSVFGGSINSQNYDALALGVGRDLDAFGAISFDITESFARLSGESATKTGTSFRVNYSKRFDEYNSQVQFAGYRFTQRNFISMADYLSIVNDGSSYRSNKELYTISLNKTLPDWQTSLYFNYDHQTYWDSASVDRYSMMASKYIDLGSVRNISVSLSAYRQVNHHRKNNGLFFSFSIPLGSSSSAGYSLSTTSNETINQANYYNTIDNKMSYQLSAGHSKQGATASGYYTYQGNNARLTANASYLNNEYVSFGVGVRGGLTVTADGAGLHRVSRMGGTRLMVDTDGVADIPIKGNGPEVTSNMFGKAVIPDVNSYYKNKVKIDLNKLPDNAEVTDSVVQLTLTDGAIGYREFSVLSGQKRMVNFKLSNNNAVPFGAQIVNFKGQETGIVDDNGLAYVSGIKPNEEMFIKWNGKAQCKVRFPAKLSDNSEQLTLVCEDVSL